MKLENNKTEAISNLKHIKSDNLTDWYKATNNIETDFKAIQEHLSRQSTITHK